MFPVLISIKHSHIIISIPFLSKCYISYIKFGTCLHGFSLFMLYIILDYRDMCLDFFWFSCNCFLLFFCDSCALKEKRQLYLYMFHC